MYINAGSNQEVPMRSIRFLSVTQNEFTNKIHNATNKRESTPQPQVKEVPSIESSKMKRKKGVRLTLPEQILPFGMVLLGFNQGPAPPCIGRLSLMPSLKRNHRQTAVSLWWRNSLNRKYTLTQ